MIAAHRRRKDKLDREAVFFTDNHDDFKAGTAHDLTLQIDANIALILTQDAKLTSSFDDKDQKQEIKGDKRDEALDRIREVILGATAIGNTAVPGITSLFQMPSPRTDQNIIAKLTAMNDETAPYEQNFIDAGLDANFRNNLIAARDAFQTSRNAAASAAEHHGEAVGTIEDLFRTTMSMSRQRGAFVKLKYSANPGKLAAWAIASHLEKAPQSTPAPPSPPTP